jgi:hypothetical protein
VPAGLGKAIDIPTYLLNLMSDNPSIVTSKKQVETILRRVIQEDLKLKDIVIDAVRRALKSKWMHRNSVKEEYDVTDRQLQYLRDKNKVTYSQRKRRIWYLRESIESYFEEGRVNGQSESP